MSEQKAHTILKTLEPIVPDLVRLIIKRVYWAVIRIRNKYTYIKKGKRVEFGCRFRFERAEPYKAYVGDRTIAEDFNVWNANVGDIVVGKKCWFGLHNVVMGPVEIGDAVSTGPRVAILGPRHPVLESGTEKRDRTVIGNNVWISTGSIILFGVHIGNNAIIGAGSVVSKDVPEGAFVAGNPARDLSRIAGVSWEARKS